MSRGLSRSVRNLAPIPGASADLPGSNVTILARTTIPIDPPEEKLAPQRPDAGPQVGLQAIAGLQPRRISELAGGTIRPELHDVLVSEDHTEVLATIRAARAASSTCWSTTSEPCACAPKDSSAPATRTSPGRCR